MGAVRVDLLSPWIGRIALAVGVIGIVSILGCSDANAPGRKRIGVSLLTLQDDFFQDLKAGLEEEAAKHGYEVVVDSAEKDPAKQDSLLRQFETQRYDAVVVSPCDSAGIVPRIESLNAKGIPVFTADIAADGGDVVCHVASDNHLGGQLAAKRLVEFMGETGKVLIIDHPEVTSVQQRVAAFEAEIAKHPAIEIVAKQSSSGDRDKAYKVTKNVLRKHPELSGIFGINDACALGALRAIGDQNIVIIGYDGSTEARAAIRAGGALKADVVQNPRLIGIKTMQAIHQYFSGQKPSASIPVEVGTIDKSQLGS